MTDAAFKRSVMRIGIRGAATKHGLKYSTAWKRAKRLGVTSPEDMRNRPRKWTGKRAAEFRRMWERGDVQAAIARHFRISVANAQAVRKRLGLEPRGLGKENTPPRRGVRTQRLIKKLLAERGPLTWSEISSLTGMSYKGGLHSSFTMLVRKNEVWVDKSQGKPYRYNLRVSK